MPLPQKVGDLEGGGTGAGFIDGLHADEAQHHPVEGIPAAEPTHHRGEGHIGGFVLVGSEHGPLGLQHADHLERLVADPQLPAQGRARGHQLVLQVWTDHHHVAYPLEVAGTEEAPLGDLEAAHREELGCHPGDGGTG